MLSDFKQAMRSLRKTPALTAVVVATLALGIGANTAIFSMVSAALLKPVPYSHPDRLAFLWEKSDNFEFASIAWPDLQDWREGSRAFESIGGFRWRNYRMRAEEGPQTVGALQVTASLFKTLGVPPLLGRGFTEEEDRVGAPGLVMLTHAFWRRQFGSDPGVLGKAIELNGKTYTVIGVLRPELALETQLGRSLQVEQVDVWTPLGPLMGAPEFQSRGNHAGIVGLGRLRSGYSIEQGLSELQGISARIIANSPPQPGLMRAAGAPLIERSIQGYEGLWVLQGAVALVLLIACANVASLLSARGAAREAELAVRAALGASRAQLMRQLFAESALLAIAGGLLGLLAAGWIHQGIIALEPPGVTLLERAQLSAGVLTITALLSVATAVLFGLWPALKHARPDLQAAMQSSGRTTSGSGAAGGRGALVVVQIALTMVLLCGSGLLVKSFLRAQSVDLGFDPDGLLVARIELPTEVYDTPEKVRGFGDRLLPALQALPGVDTASLSAFTPLQTGWQTSYTVPAKMAATDAQPYAEMNIVSDEYLQTMRIPLLRGRGFGPQDGPEGAPSVIIDEATARRYWPDGDWIGKEIRLGGANAITVIGVVPTLRLYGYAQDPQYSQFYLSRRQNTVQWISVLVRTSDPAALAASVRQAVRVADPNQPVWGVGSFAEHVQKSFSAMRLYGVLFGVFAGIALLLAVIGLYGLLAFTVTRHTREYGIRIALGAFNRQVIQHVLAGGVRLLAMGLVVGVVAVLLLGRVLSALLFQTSPADPAVLLGVVLILAVVALFACWLPARRATQVDPLVALRSE